jgi:hypothetical protein
MAEATPVRVRIMGFVAFCSVVVADGIAVL